MAGGAPIPIVPSGLYDRPVLVVDLGTHTASIRSASADRDGRWAVTGSDDKTVRIWSLADGKFERTIRLPAGPGNVGKVDALAMSPDGALIAAGGWTRWTEAEPQEQIYLFDRATGTLVKRIEGLPSDVNSLMFSPDGDRLAAGLSSGGLRVYASESSWDETARDEDYGDQVYSADFAPDGRLATTAYDRKLRLYAPGSAGAVRPTIAVGAPDGKAAYRLAFSSPDGALIAALSQGALHVLDGRILSPLRVLDISDVQTDPSPTIGSVTWLRDGRTLVAGGGNKTDGDFPVLAWVEAGAGPRRLLAEPANSVMTLVALPNGDVLVADAIRLVRLGSSGTPRWAQQRQIVDFWGQLDLLTVSANGSRIGFAYGPVDDALASFDLASRKLTLGPGAGLAAPNQTGLRIEQWRGSGSPTLNGEPLDLDPGEESIALAIRPSNKGFVMGTRWWLRSYDAEGVLSWRRPVPSDTFAANITADGRLVVAAYGDGTIRWHRMTDGVELLAFMPLAGRSDWVAWTPEGFYAATAGAQGVLRWHVNRGWDPADSVPIANIPGSYRPEVLPLVLQELETPRALGLAVLAEQNRQVMLHTNSSVSPGAQLHLLAIGIDQYNEEYAKHLRLQFAGGDARDLASAILNTQDALYRVKPTLLLDKDANKKGILRALDQIGADMAHGTGADLAVIHFSGHGALVGGKLYLLPYEVNSRDNAGIQSDGLSVEELRTKLAELGRHGRVLVLLDACHSGATNTNGSPLAMDSTALRTALAAANVSVLTSSTGAEVSYETPELQHGAFTKALLDAFDDPAADVNRNGLITPTGLAAYISNRVPILTDDKQHPGMEVRYDSTLFATSR